VENAYVKIPRNVLHNVFFGEDDKQRLARLHLQLMMSCNFGEGIKNVNGRDAFCRRAEYAGDYQELAEQLQWPYQMVRRQMQLLAKQHRRKRAARCWPNLKSD
jgi:hypothetical protein